MYDIIIKSCQCETVDSDKGEFSLIYPHNDIHFVLSGKGYYNGRLILPGEGFVCRRDRKESYVQDKDDPWTYFFARLTGSDVDMFFDMLEGSGSRFAFELGGEFLPVVKAASAVNYEEKNDSDFGRAFFNIIARYIEGLSDRAHDMSHAGKNRYVEEAKAFIKANYWQRLSVALIAGELHINPDYLGRLFQRYEGLSTQEYILNYRIRHAKALLELKKFKITEIARSVGYENVGRFSKLFKQKTGLNPTEYRDTVTIK